MTDLGVHDGPIRAFTMNRSWRSQWTDPRVHDAPKPAFVVLIPDGLVLYSRPTTALPLKAGSNVIYLHAPGATTLDAADIDAINVLPQGTGAPPLATPVMSGN